MSCAQLFTARIAPPLHGLDRALLRQRGWMTVLVLLAAQLTLSDCLSGVIRSAAEGTKTRFVHRV